MSTRTGKTVGGASEGSDAAVGVTGGLITGTFSALQHWGYLLLVVELNVGFLYQMLADCGSLVRLWSQEGHSVAGCCCGSARMELSCHLA